MNRLNTDEADDFERDLRGLAATIEPQTAFVTRLESQLMNTEQRKLSLWSRLAASLRSNEPASVLDADGFVVRQIAPTQRPQSTVSRGVASAMFAAVVLVIVAGFLLLPLMNARRVAVPQAAATGVPTAPMTATATTTTDLVVFGDVLALEAFTTTKVVANQPISLTLSLRALKGPFDGYALMLKASRNDTPILASPIGTLDQLSGGRALSSGQRFSVTVPIDLWSSMLVPTDVYTVALSVESSGAGPKRAALPVLQPSSLGETRHEAALTTLSLSDSTSVASCRMDLNEEDAVNKAVRLIWPAQGSITQGFWYGHKGIDIANAVGVPVRAAADGMVSYAGWSQAGYGYMVMIDHTVPATFATSGAVVKLGNTNATTITATQINATSQSPAMLIANIQTLYAQMSQWYVDTGQFVKAGQVIGAMGSTGNSTGPHLHFEVRLRSKQCDPFLWLPGDAPNERLRWYTVQAGDTVSGIAMHFGMSGLLLQQLNPGLDPDQIRIGQMLVVQVTPATK